jgi:hydroxysqualene dehydroxylase
MKVAVIGAGWAGCAAAVEARGLGHEVTLYEAARTLGGRARRLDAVVGGQPVALDNGQHILIGAYTDTLALMRRVGIDTDAALLRLPLALRAPDGSGIALPDLPPPLDAAWGILGARGWSLADKGSMLRQALRWRRAGFVCGAGQSVADICATTPRVMRELIAPLCVSALNTPAERASGAVFLRVLRDALFGGRGASNLLLPRTDLGALFPDAAAAWLQREGGALRWGRRVTAVTPAGAGWSVQAPASGDREQVDAVVLACPVSDAVRLVRSTGAAAQAWLARAEGLRFEAITTVYAFAPGARLAAPLLALPVASDAPAQFAFDRGQLGGPAGLLALVISASDGSADMLTALALRQARQQLGLPLLQAVKTVVEKRATFACTPGLQRPAAQIAPGLLACGDYVDGPYPATLEGAVRSGLEASRHLGKPGRSLSN